MKTYCNNEKCSFIKKLEIPINFSFRKFYVPIGEEDLKCKFECSRKFCGFITLAISGKKVIHNITTCMAGYDIGCDRRECIWNNVDKSCGRDEILIDKLEIDNEIYWVCKCFSNKKISGHKDWMRHLNSDGTPKGGSIDDSYSEVLEKDNKVTRSFPDHFRQAKEERKKR